MSRWAKVEFYGLMDEPADGVAAQRGDVLATAAALCGTFGFVAVDALSCELAPGFCPTTVRSESG